MCLCESLYPALNTLEISIRNSINLAMGIRHGAMWFDSTNLPFNGYQQGCIHEAKQELARQGRPISSGGIVAELSFGFWTSMFSSHMDRSWRGLLKNLLPNSPPHNRTVSHMRATLSDIRRFRNRVFHHERILHCNPTDQHQECRVIIGWVSDVKLKALNLVDRFPDVYANGLQSIKSSVAASDLSSESSD